MPSSSSNASLPPPSSSSVAAAGEEGWALKADVELCGSILPPTYDELHTDAHLNTFDVSDAGTAVLLSDCGRLFLLNLFQPPSATKKQPPTAATVRLVHLELDPALTRDELRAIERVQVNALGTAVLLVARKWLKVVRIPAEATAAAVAGAGAPAAGAPRSKAPAGAFAAALGSPSTSFRLHYLVRFDDGATETVAIDAPRLGATAASAALVTQQLPAHRRQQRIVSISREVYCASIRAVGYFTRIQHVAWHPLSDAHVVVLSDAEELTVFNLQQQDVSKPEQRHRLDFRHLPATAAGRRATSVGFAFGSQQMLWDVFTCYILRSDGAVFSLCPLVPYDARVPESVLHTLQSEVEAQLTLQKRRLADADADVDEGAVTSTSIAELKSQKYWLQEAWAPAAPPSSPVTRHSGQSSSQPEGPGFARCLKPHISGISPETWPLAVQGPVIVTPSSVVEGKNHVTGGSVASSLLVVPSATKTGGTLSTNPFLMRSFTSGHVELLLLDAPVRPRWKCEPQQSHALPALLLECLNLGVDDSGGRAVLQRDASDPRLVYCLHSTGVHVLNVAWVFALAAGKQFTSLPKTSVRHIFSVSPSTAGGSMSVTNVIGARVIKNVYLGHMLLLRLASGTFEVVNVSAASSELIKGVLDNHDGLDAADRRASLPDTLASMAASKAAASSSAASRSGTGIRPFSEIVEEKVEALTTRGTRVTGNTQLHEVDDAVLAFMIERVKILYEDVEYVDVMDQLLKDRLRLHCEMVKTHSEKAATVQQSIATTTAGLRVLQDKVEKAMQAQQNLRKRAAAVLQAVKENQPILSHAEREYKDELEQLSIEVRRMKPRVTQLTVSGQRMVRNLENQALSAASHRRLLSGGHASVLTDEKKKMCFDVLRAETQLIEDAKTLIEDMTTNLKHLEKA